MRVNYNSKDKATTQASSVVDDEETKTMRYRHTTGYYSTIKKKKKKEILIFATTRMDFNSIMPSEIRQTEKDKHRMISLIFEISKKRTHRESDQICVAR